LLYGCFAGGRFRSAFDESAARCAAAGGQALCKPAKAFRHAERADEIVADGGDMLGEEPSGAFEPAGTAKMDEFGVFRHGALHRSRIGKLNAGVAIAGL